MTMERVVKSTNIREIGYDPITRRLRVKFLNGDTGEYLDVPRAAWEAFRAAPSKGRHLHQHLRGSYEWQKVA